MLSPPKLQNFPEPKHQDFESKKMTASVHLYHDEATIVITHDKRHIQGYQQDCLEAIL